MDVDKESLIKLISVLMSDAEARKTVTHSLEGGLICGTSCMIGGIVAGPPGLLIGGTLGGALAYALKKDKFLPIGEVLRKLPKEQYEILVQLIQNVAKKFGVENFGLFKSSLDENDEMRESVIDTVISFISKMKLKIVYRQ